jgi:hypothetical protein
MAGCWLELKGTVANPDPDQIYVNDRDCAAQSNFYLCSTNDYQQGAAVKTLPNFMDQLTPTNFSETSVLENTIAAVQGGFQRVPCQPTLQDQLDAYCRSTYADTPYARFDSSDEDRRLPAWRCFDANSLDFSSQGLCVDDSGSCVECLGDRITTEGRFNDADAALRGLIQAKTSTSGICAATLQHRMNHWCATTTRTLHFARVVRTRTAALWSCFASSSLDFESSDRSCVNDLGYCTNCKGKVIKPTAVTAELDARLRVSLLRV